MYKSFKISLIFQIYLFILLPNLVGTILGFLEIGGDKSTFPFQITEQQKKNLLRGDFLESLVGSSFHLKTRLALVNLYFFINMFFNISNGLKCHIFGGSSSFTSLMNCINVFLQVPYLRKFLSTLGHICDLFSYYELN